jgi:hypothetical protein
MTAVTQRSTPHASGERAAALRQADEDVEPGDPNFEIDLRELLPGA